MRKIYLSLFFCSIVFTSLAQTPLDTAPDFSAKDIRGVMHYLYPILDSNKFVLLDFFTTTCGPCVTYAPEIQEAFEHFGANQGEVRFLGINYADDNEGVAAFDSIHGIEFPTISGLDGHGNMVAITVFNVQSFPTLVFIAPNRLILNKQIFPPSFQNLDSTLSSSMAVYTNINNHPEGYQGFSVLGIHPNPASEFAIVELQTSADATFDYAVLAMTGETIMRRDKIHCVTGTHRLNLPVASLKPGIYFVRFTRDGMAVANTKLIIK